jgi:hypothetical protein
MLIREQVARINVCRFCTDIGRWFSIQESMDQAKFDALEEYGTSALFSDAERAALDYATELTKNKTVDPDTFGALARHYSQREICEIVWLVARLQPDQYRSQYSFGYALRPQGAQKVARVEPEKTNTTIPCGYRLDHCHCLDGRGQPLCRRHRFRARGMGSRQHDETCVPHSWLFMVGTLPTRCALRRQRIARSTQVRTAI